MQEYWRDYHHDESSSFGYSQRGGYTERTLLFLAFDIFYQGASSTSSSVSTTLPPAPWLISPLSFVLRYLGNRLRALDFLNKELQELEVDDERSLQRE